MSRVKRFDLKLPIFTKLSEEYKLKARAFTSPGFIDIHTQITNYPYNLKYSNKKFPWFYIAKIRHFYEMRKRQ